MLALSGRGHQKGHTPDTLLPRGWAVVAGSLLDENITEECHTYGFPEAGSLQETVVGSGVRFTMSHGVYSSVCPRCDKDGCVHRSH